MTFAITGRATYAGISGAVGQWMVGGATSVFTVNPNVPLPLYAKLVTDDKNYLEYIMVEISGF